MCAADALKYGDLDNQRIDDIDTVDNHSGEC